MATLFPCEPGHAAGALLAVALVAILAIYLRSLSFDFVYDDRYQIVLNPHIQSWEHAKQYFTSHLWSHLYRQDVGFNYRPLFLLWLRLNHVIFDLHPWGWHLSTVLLHVLVTASVFLLTARLTASGVVGAISALIFGLHPAHVEAVSWISGVSEPLLASFLISSFLSYLKHRDTGRRRWKIIALTLFAMAMLAKETAAVLPLLILVHAWSFPQGKVEGAPKRGRLPQALQASLPFLLVAILLLTVRWLVLQGPGKPLTDLSLRTLVLTWPSLLLFYVKVLVWPIGLSPFYDTPYVVRIGLSDFILPLTIVGLVALGLWWGARRSAAVRFASLWMILTLLPALNLRYLSVGEIAHDRYVYLPSVGFAMLTALAVTRLRFGPPGLGARHTERAIVLFVLAGLLGWGTWHYQRYWANELILHQRGVEKAPHNRFALDGLGTALAEHGRGEEALVAYHRAVSLYPNYWASNFNLGRLYYERGDLERADHFLSQAARLQPTRAGPIFYLGLTRLKMGRPGEATELLRQAVAFDPTAAGHHFALGMLLKLRGDLHGALQEFQSELVVNPGEAHAQQQIAEITAVLLGRRTGNSASQPPGNSK